MLNTKNALQYQQENMLYFGVADMYDFQRNVWIDNYQGSGHGMSCYVMDKCYAFGKTRKEVLEKFAKCNLRMSKCQLYRYEYKFFPTGKEPRAICFFQKYGTKYEQHKGLTEAEINDIILSPDNYMIA